MSKIDECSRLSESWCRGIRMPVIPLYLAEPVNATGKSELQALALPPCPGSPHLRSHW